MLPKLKKGFLILLGVIGVFVLALFIAMSIFNSPTYARAIDYARFGLLFLHNGFWNGVQILPKSWVAESTQPLRPDPRAWETFPSWPEYGGYYKYHWWGINNADGTYDFYAHGKYDEIVYITPRKNVVIVRLGDSLDENIIWPLVIHNIVDQLK